jgi:hypothetical protein
MADNPTSLSLLDRVVSDDQAAWTRLVQLYTPRPESLTGRRGP